MVFKTFRIKILTRLMLITALIALIVYFSTKPYYYFTLGELIILVIALIIELIYFIEKGYRQISQMLESLKERDFNLKFQPIESGAVFHQQAQILTRLMQSYRDIRIEKEVHYQFLNLIVDQLSYGIICFDTSGNVKLANKTLKQLCGANSINHISLINRIDKNLSNELEMLRSGEEKLLSILKDGEILKYTVSCIEIRLLDDRFKLVALHNIHSTLQEHELDSHKKLIQILTHEIMNSVTPILSLSESMNEHLKDDEGRFRGLDKISKQEAEDLMLGYEAIEIRSRALMRFVSDFRSLTRLPEPRFERIQIDNLFRNILSLYRSELDEKGIKCNVYLSPNITIVKADRAMLDQVLINLLRNSIEALADCLNPEIIIEPAIEQNHVLFTITDNGKGIPPDNLDKIFIPFFTTKKDGSGIGLSLSHYMMQLQGGTMHVKSIQGLKTTFTLRFPNK